MSTENIDDILQTSEAPPDAVMSEEEQRAYERGPQPERTPGQKLADKVMADEDDEPAPGDAPDPAWMKEALSKLPEGFKFPRGYELAWCRLKANITVAKHKGNRWCLIWPLTDTEERLASKRCRGDSTRTISELTKQSIRLIDGKRVDWSAAGDPDTMISVEQFWKEIGPKGRQVLQTVYLKLHTLDMAEQADFFVNCLRVKKAAT